MVEFGGQVIIVGLFADVDTPYTLNGKLENLQTGWTITSAQYNGGDVILPTKINNIPVGDPITLTRRLPANLPEDTFLFFRSSQQKVKVLIDGELCYEFGHNESRIFGKSPGSAWIIIPHIGKQADGILEIQLVGMYQFYSGNLNPIYLGSEGSIISHILIGRLGSLIITFSLLIFGIVLSTASLLFRKRRSVKSLFRLAVLSITVGIWGLCAINVLQLLVGNVHSLLNLEFLMLLLLLPVALWFFDSLDQFQTNRMLRILFWISLTVCILSHILQVLNLVDYMSTLSVLHCLFIIAILYLIVVIVRSLAQGKSSNELKFFFFSLLQLLLFATIDIINYYVLPSQDEGFFTRIGLLLFIISWASVILKNMSDYLIHTTRARVLEELAYKDQMTGLKNRTAFEEKLQEFREKPSGEAYIIVCDINNLKKVNDNLGHAKGDELIKGIANAILREFSIGYRIGGDEICVLIEDATQLSNEALLNKISIIKEEMHRLGTMNSLSSSLACGYSKVTLGNCAEIDKAYRLADSRMYTDKEAMKAVIHNG